MIRAFLGAKVAVRDIFPDYKNEEVKDFCFARKWDETEPKLLEALEDDFELIERLKELYDWFVLALLLKGEKDISSAMINRYETHGSQLSALKKLVKEKAKDKYYRIFRKCNPYTDKETKTKKILANYPAYIGSNLSNGKTVVQKCGQEAFYDFLKKELADVLTDEIKTAMEGGQFLLKLRSKDNSSIPHQLHYAELDKILNNAGRYGLLTPDTAEKIRSVLTFRVPYFVGRTNPYYKNHPDKAHHVWIERKTGEKIRPWNFEKVVDLKKSGENFITKMLSQCTYLRNEKVIPKNSLLYSEYTVLNELNKLKIKGEQIPVGLKKEIYEELFKKEKKVSLNQLLNFLRTKSDYREIQKDDISGIDVKGNSFNASLGAYHQVKDLFGILGEKEAKEIADDVILWQALHTDKKIVRKSITEKYPDLEENIVKKLTGLNYTGFGKLSGEFLNAQKVICKKTGCVTSIIDLLRETNQNLMEIIHNPDYNVSEWLNGENYGGINDADFYSVIQDCYASPGVKRSVWQAVKVTEELISLNAGRAPDKIFIEVTRSNKADKGDKGRTKKRRDNLQELYKNCVKIDADLKNELSRAGDDELRGEKLYLYFLQCGKCAYSGEPIKIADLNSRYDVDHIVPQALKKDDSLNNKVLVKKELNMKKDKNYPLNQTNEIWNKKDVLIPMWLGWRRCGLMSDVKLDALIRTSTISEKELEGFINRQLVFTGQSAAVAIDLFKQKYKNAEVVYSKAENVSDFRHKFDLLKCRDANDHHHAHDAYLNIVVGNTYDRRFSKPYLAKFERDNDFKTKYSQNHMFEYNVDGAWKAGVWQRGAQIEKGETLITVERHVSLESGRYKYLPVSKKTRENKGAFYKQTVYPAKEHQKVKYAGDRTVDKILPRKGGESPLRAEEKYGGYSVLRPAYFMIIEYDYKGDKIREFVSVSILDNKRLEKEKLTAAEYKAKLETELSKERGYKVKIVLDKILINSLFRIALPKTGDNTDKIGYMEIRLAGRNETNMLFHNAKQLFLDKKSSDYVRIIAKYNKAVKDKKIKPEDYADKDSILLSGKNDGRQKEYRLTKEDNLYLWNNLLGKIKDLYGNMDALKGTNLGLPDIYDKLKKHEKEFTGESEDGDKTKNLPLIKQIDVLSALIKGLGCNPEAFDLSGFGDGKKRVGTIQPGRKIKYPLTLVNQSVTGVKENSVVICRLDENDKPVYPEIEAGDKN
jgi:CRISPR-associated endonuclease Csn1